MIFRLQYCNDSGDTAMIDIETKTGVGVQEIEGSGKSNPFSLQYKTEKSDKSGRFMTSSANIEIYENEFFNIDILKTSNETDIKVSYYINEVLEWQGFVLPDFFSKEIKDNAVISMTASDRINTLKAVTLSDLPNQIELRELAELCLVKTGLTLPLHTMADFTHADENNDTLFRAKIQSQRLDDEKGRSISCYDILESILILSNAQLVQRKGVWQIVNKYQLEQGVGKNYNSPRGFNNWSKTLHNFTFIGKGAIRTITPVASSVGIFQEYGGGRRYPDNYDFRESGGWTARNGFTFTRDNREIKSYNVVMLDYTPVLGVVTNNYYILHQNSLNSSVADFLNSQPYLNSVVSPIAFSHQSASIEFEINATVPKAFLSSGTFFRGAHVNYAIIAEGLGHTLVLNKSGQFVPMISSTDNLRTMAFDSNKIVNGNVEALTRGEIIKGELVVPEGTTSDYSISIRLYGDMSGGGTVPKAINFAKFTVKSEQEVAKGTLYKTTQGTDFTREHDIETSIFGDYLTKGLNGYFYDYQNDDTGSLIKSNNDKTNLWTAPNETESLPLLQQISRQKARQFSIAHDIIRGDIEIKNFDPLTIFKDCNNYEYVVVSATFDFLRSIANVEIEQILYDNSIDRRDFVFSFFGEGENSIKSVGGISGGSSGTGGGGGMTSSQLEMLTNLADWWKLDEENDAIYSEKSVYSLKGVSALGLGEGGSGGGGDGGADMLDSWANYTPAKANYYVPASLLVPFRNDTLSRLTSLENGSATSIVTTGSGNAITSLTKSGTVITANKGLSFALASHTHTIAQITGLQGALDSKATQSDISTAINVIEIGGRNLIPSFTNPIWGGWNTSINVLPNKISTDGGMLTKDIYADLELNTNYILSIESTARFWLYFLNKEGEELSYKVYSSRSTPILFNTGEDVVRLQLRINPSSSQVTSPWYYQNIKLEKGNKPTDWTPSPEDQVSDWSTTDATSFSYIKNKPTTLSGYGITDGVNKSVLYIDRRTITPTSTPVATMQFGFTSLNLNNTSPYADFIDFGGYIDGSGGAKNLLVFSKSANKTIRLYQGVVGSANYNSYVDVWHSGNLAPVTLNTAQTITGAKTFSTLLTASAGVNTPKVDFGNGFTIEPSGTELVFKYNGVIKQRMLSDGTILATAGITALSTE